MKRRIRLTEGQLRNIIRSNVKRALNEGSTDNSLYNKWMEIIENVGAEAFLDNIWNWLSSDQLEQIVEYAIQDGLIDDEEDVDEEW